MTSEQEERATTRNAADPIRVRVRFGGESLLSKLWKALMYRTIHVERFTFGRYDVVERHRLTGELRCKRVEPPERQSRYGDTTD